MAFPLIPVLIVGTLGAGAVYALTKKDKPKKKPLIKKAGSPRQIFERQSKTGRPLILYGTCTRGVTTALDDCMRALAKNNCHIDVYKAVHGSELSPDPALCEQLGPLGGMVAVSYLTEQGTARISSPLVIDDLRHYDDEMVAPVCTLASQLAAGKEMGGQFEDTLTIGTSLLR